MIPNFDLASGKALNVGNSYTYTVTAADQAAYSGFFVTAADTITVGDGTNTVDLVLAANEPVTLNGSVTSIVGTLTNVVIFTY
jgi:hypothetical protein